jgi:hypothetical protein
MAVMVAAVFFINGFTKHSWGKDVFLLRSPSPSA